MDRILFSINYNKMDNINVIIAFMLVIAIGSLFLEKSIKEEKINGLMVYIVLLSSLIIFSGGTYLNKIEKNRVENLICTDLEIDFARCDVSGYSLYITIIKESKWKFQVEKNKVSPIKDRDVIVINLAPGDLLDKDNISIFNWGYFVFFYLEFPF